VLGVAAELGIHRHLLHRHLPGHLRSSAAGDRAADASDHVLQLLEHGLEARQFGCSHHCASAAGGSAAKAAHLRIRNAAALGRVDQLLLNSRILHRQAAGQNRWQHVRTKRYGKPTH